MKRYLAAVLALLITGISSGGLTVKAEITEIKVVVDGHAVTFPDQQPMMIQDRVLVPVRALFETMGAQVEYIASTVDKTETVVVSNDASVIFFEIGSCVVQVGQGGSMDHGAGGTEGSGGTVGIEYLDVPAQLVNDRTMVPLRFMSENLGYGVDWQEDTNTVVITTMEPESEEDLSPEESVDSAIAQKIQTESRFSAGRHNTAVVKEDGTIWAWGDNTYGQLGSFEGGRSEEPVKISGIFNAVAVACGQRTLYALKSDGTVWAWGDNTYGQLGTGSPEKKVSVPAQVKDLANITHIEAGESFALALDNRGQVWSWGRNNKGQLGLGDMQDRNAPEQVKGLEGTVASVSAGTDHALAAMASGDKRVWAWGSNTYGQLGKGVGVKMNAKPAMISGISRIVQVKAGGMQSLGLRTDGSVYMWGTTYLGEPAADAPENYADEDGYYRYEEPLRMRVIYYDEEREEDRALILLNAVQLSCGDEHSVAVAGGQIYAWGNSSLMTVRQKDQLWRLNAQVYDGMNVIAAYAGRERDIYALDAAGDLWNVGSKGKARIMSLK